MISWSIIYGSTDMCSNLMLLLIWLSSWTYYCNSLISSGHYYHACTSLQRCCCRTIKAMVGDLFWQLKGHSSLEAKLCKDMLVNSSQCKRVEPKMTRMFCLCSIWKVHANCRNDFVPIIAIALYSPSLLEEQKAKVLVFIPRQEGLEMVRFQKESWNMANGECPSA